MPKVSQVAKIVTYVTITHTKPSLLCYRKSALIWRLEQSSQQLEKKVPLETHAKPTEMLLIFLQLASK